MNLPRKILAVSQTKPFPYIDILYSPEPPLR